MLSKYRCLAVAMDACLLQSSSGLLSCAALRGCCGNGWQQLCDQAAPEESPLLGAGWGSPCCCVCELDAGSWWGTGRGMDRGWGLNGVGGVLAVIVGSQYEGPGAWLGRPLVFQPFVPGVHQVFQIPSLPSLLWPFLFTPIKIAEPQISVLGIPQPDYLFG